MKARPFVFTTADSTRTGGKEPCDGDLGKRRASVGITKRPMDKHFVRDVESGGAWHALKRLLRHRPRGHYPARVRIQRIDHVGIVVDDLAAATTFPVDIGFELEGGATLASPTVRTHARGSPVGHRDDAAPGRPRTAREPSKYHTPRSHRVHPCAPTNTPGIRHITFPVEASTTSSTACGFTAPNSLASSSSTRTSTGSATSVAPRGSSSSWRTD